MPLFLAGIGASFTTPVNLSGELAVYQGKIISIAGGKLAASDRDGRERSNTLAADARVTCDGAACNATDLKPGMRIRVTAKEGAKNVAIAVEALDKNERFEKRDRDPRPPIATA